MFVCRISSSSFEAPESNGLMMVLGVRRRGSQRRNVGDGENDVDGLVMPYRRS